jgi:branched-subunit amino acid aminotransferase/4-amino-4-deoxychorismate lyase
MVQRMGDLPLTSIEIDGRAATVESLWSAVGGGYGHFTAMQVRDGKVRGTDLHLARLEAGTRALFGVGLDGERVRELIRHALGSDTRDASVRVHVFGSESDAVSVMVTVREPASMPSAPQSLRTVAYQRPLAHIKHLGGFGQAHYGRLAKKEGFDEALLVGPDGVISEGSITNIGFVEGDTVVWPDAPALHGISMQVLERELRRAGMSWRRRTVSVADIETFGGAFITNSRGIAPVGRIDGTILPTDAELGSTVVGLFHAAPWDPI